MARIEPELKVTDRLGEMAMFLLKEMVVLSLMKSVPVKRSWSLFASSLMELAVLAFCALSALAMVSMLRLRTLSLTEN